MPHKSIEPTDEQVAAAQGCCPCWGDRDTGPETCGEGGDNHAICELHSSIARLLAEHVAQERERCALWLESLPEHEKPFLSLKDYADGIRASALAPPPEPMREVSRAITSGDNDRRDTAIN